MIKAVIFDLDGTLIDTEKYYRIYWPRAVAEFGYTMTDEQALSIRSLGRPFAMEWFRENIDQNLDYWAVRDCRKALMEEFFKTHPIELKPGAIEILSFLRKRRICVALATANEEERANRYLKELGLFEYFDRVICANMVECGKPAGDIYAYACRELGLEPSSCIAVEDSPNGIKSAYAAGCKPVFVPDQTDVSDEIRPLLYDRIENLLDLRRIVDTLV